MEEDNCPHNLINTRTVPMQGDIAEDSYNIDCPQIPSIGVAKEIMRDWFPDPVARKAAIHMVQLLQLNAVKALSSLPQPVAMGEDEVAKYLHSQLSYAGFEWKDCKMYAAHITKRGS